MKIRIVGGTAKITSDGDIVFNTVGGGIEFNALKRNIWTAPNTVIGDYEEIELANDYERYGPWLILHSAKKKGRNENDNGTALDMMYGDYPENEIGIQKLKQELKQEYINVKLKKKKEDIFPLIKPSDEIIKNGGEKLAEYKIEKIRDYLKKDNKKLFDIFREDIKSYSMGDLEDVAIDMVNKMQANKGGEYSNTNLNYAAKNHHSFVDFADGVEFALAQQISEGKRIENLVTAMETPAKKHFFYNALVDNHVKHPQFSDYIYDSLHSLKILINDVWAYEVRVVKYYKYYERLGIDLQYNLYDHFGLDYPDIQKFDQEIFYVWFILQHFRGYKPLLTNVEIKRTYWMIVPENW